MHAALSYGFVHDVEKQIEAQWKKKADTQDEVIKKVNKFDQKNYWNFQIKPYHQYQILQSLTDSTKILQPILSNALFKGQVRSRISQPTRLKPMIDICQLHDQIQKKGWKS